MWFSDTQILRERFSKKTNERGVFYVPDIKKPSAMLAHSRRRKNPRKTSKNAEFRLYFITLAELLQDMKGKHNDYY